MIHTNIVGIKDETIDCSHGDSEVTIKNSASNHVCM